MRLLENVLALVLGAVAAMPALYSNTAYSSIGLGDVFYSLDTISFLPELILLGAAYAILSLGRLVINRQYFTNAQTRRIVGATIGTLSAMYAARIWSAASVVSGYYGESVFFLFVSVAFQMLLTAVFLTLVATPFLGLFQLIFRVKRKIHIPLMVQARSMIGITLALGLIYGFAYVTSLYSPILFFFAGFLPFALAMGYLAFYAKVEGTQVYEKDHPALFQMIRDVSREIDVPFPDRIVVVPTTEIAVTGLRKKTLILGLASLRGLTKEQLRSIIAHEMGHLYGGDTAIGYFIGSLGLAMRKSLEVSSRVAGFHLIAILLHYLYVGYFWAYSALTAIHSRSVEYRADRVAAYVSGGKMFGDALKEYVVYTFFFDRVVPQMIVGSALDGKIYQNIYKSNSEIFSQGKLDEIRKIVLGMEKKESLLGKLFSSHPHTSDRIRAVENASAKPVEERGPASGYFKDSVAIEEKATDELTKRVLKAARIMDKEGNVSVVKR